MTTKPSSLAQEHPDNDSGLGLGLLHLAWGLFGPMFLIGSIVLCASGPRGWFTIRDAAPVLVLAAMIPCRWLEHRSGKGTTLYGDPSTPKHFRHWVIIQLSVAVLGWVTANVISIYILS